MNKFTRILALLLLVAMTMTMVSCDLINGIIGGNHEHSFTEGKCECGETDPDYKPEGSTDLVATIAELTEKYDTTKTFYVTATVKEVVDATTGEIVIEDATGTITVMLINGWDSLESKPDEYDSVVLACKLGKSKGKVCVIGADLQSFTAVEAPKHEHSFNEGKCECGETDPDYKPEVKTITIAEAIEIAKANSDPTVERYLICATIVKVSNPAYGEMTIADETGEIYVYGTYSEDGSIGYANMDDKPVKGDEVILSCTLNTHNGTPQVKNARLIEFTHVEVEYDESLYTEATLAEAREAEEGTLLKVSGVVAQITYANGHKPSGVILVDGTSSIYVYDGDLAGQVKVGNTVEIAATKAYYVLGTEQANADKFGYKGSNQLDSVIVLSVDKNVVDFDKSWITETTVKEIMDTPVTEDVTNLIFKVNALVKKVPGNGFVNYYIDDIDGVTGTYTYTQCNGSDFSWLDEFDGKICTVYVVAHNAKASGTGCIWRFIPVEVIDEGYKFDTSKSAEYAVKYHGVDQFLAEYTGNPALELVTLVSSELLGFEGATLSYASSNEAVVFFTTVDGKTVFNCGKTGTATVTVTGSHNGNTYSESFEISVISNESVEYITVADAIAAEDDTTVTVKGIVGPSVVNKNAFYLFGEDGSVIAVMVLNVDIFKEIKIGNEIIITGTREHHVNASKYNGNYVGEACIVDAEIVANYYGNHEYSTEKFVTGKTVEDLYALDIKTDYSTTVFVVDAIVDVQETAYYTNIKLLSTDRSVNITLYCSSANQYNWLKQFAGQVVTLELAGCNWNDKTYWAFCALAVYNEDGTKTLNELNFQ